MGSRFLPATKASPKEMMPIVDKPLIQYAVEEAVAAGIRDHGVHYGAKQALPSRITSTRPTRSSRSSPRAGRSELLELIQKIIPKSVNCIYIRQPEPLGLGHAVFALSPPVNDQVFAVILADDLIDATPPALRQMTEIFERHQSPVVAVAADPARAKPPVRHGQDRARDNGPRSRHANRREAQTGSSSVEPCRDRAATS